MILKLKKSHTMKRSILTLVLLLELCLLALPGNVTGNSPTNQRDSPQAQPAKQTQEKERLVFDIDGKRFGADETYIAERTLQNGRTIGYRKNKREIAALVKALKSDGITDEKLLNPETWLMILCSQVRDGKCINGGCDKSYCARTRSDVSTEKVKNNESSSYVLFCACRT